MNTMDKREKVELKEGRIIIRYLYRSLLYIYIYIYITYIYIYIYILSLTARLLRAAFLRPAIIDSTVT